MTIQLFNVQLSTLMLFVNVTIEVS